MHMFGFNNAAFGAKTAEKAFESSSAEKGEVSSSVHIHDPLQFPLGSLVLTDVILGKLLVKKVLI